MNALVSMCVVLGMVAVGCVADESGGGGGGGGGAESDPCSDAEAWVAGSEGGTCEASQAGALCQHEGGVLECFEERWQPVACYVDASFTCPEVDVKIVPCEPVWEGLSCGWGTADAGFSCSGTARCEGGFWLSNGVDQYECIGCEGE